MQSSLTLNNELRRVVTLREGIKGIASRAFQVNVLGLNAILLAKKFGEQARGFGVISNELRDFSHALREQMTGLSQNSMQLVDLATKQLKLTRQMALMANAAVSQPSTVHPRLQAALDRQAADYAELCDGIHGAHSRMTEWIDAAYQSCLFGTVIARSARIEAAHAGSAGQTLTDASNTFAEHVDHILPNLALLKQTVGAPV